MPINTKQLIVQMVKRMLIAFSLCSLLISCLSHPKTEKKITLEEKCIQEFDTVLNDSIYTKVNTPPNYQKGRSNDLNSALLKDIDLYDNEQEENRRIMMNILIDTNGNILNVYVPGKNNKKYTTLEKRILTNAASLSGQWTPAYCDGVKVNYRLTWYVNLEYR